MTETKTRTKKFSRRHGYINLTDMGDDVTKWDLVCRFSGKILASGVFSPALDLEDEHFDFDGVTERVAEAAGCALVNSEEFTDGYQGTLYWTVTFEYS